MEAKDTIIKADIYLPMWKKNGGRIDLICEKQAEISFKAGKEEEKEKHLRPFTMTEEEKLQNLINKLIEARHDGIKEVVDAIEKHVREAGEPRANGYQWNLIDTQWWQTKLKEWGIE